MSADIRKKKEFGDFQTPSELAFQLCDRLKASGIVAKSILEPTCGVGNFAAAAFSTWKECVSLRGFDVNSDYVDQARATIRDDRAQFQVASFFDHDWTATLDTMKGPVLVIGNLPWVTNAQMGALGGANLPQKNNFQGRNGFDAITGKANFDISEWMLLKMLDWCDTHDLTVALLVKIGVARKLLNQAWVNRRRIRNSHIRRVDTMKWFGAAVDACLLVFKSGNPEPEPECPVYSEDGNSPESILGFRDGVFVGDTRGYEGARDLLGGNPIRWRSGVKHDCSKVMEFALTENGLTNGLDEVVDLEDEYLFPLFKSSQLAKGATETAKRVLVTQRKVGDETSVIAHRAPKTWQYLLKHGDLLDARGSSIYKKNGRFAVFGIGDYSFAPFKVAISGLYKAPRFVLLSQLNGKPSMVDDTGCFLSFQHERDAAAVAESLNSPRALSFFSVFAFADAKRPYTVDVLSKINIHQLIVETLGASHVPEVLKKTTDKNQAQLDI